MPRSRPPSHKPTCGGIPSSTTTKTKTQTTTRTRTTMHCAKVGCGGTCARLSHIWSIVKTSGFTHHVPASGSSGVFRDTSCVTSGDKRRAICCAALHCIVWDCAEAVLRSDGD